MTEPIILRETIAREAESAAMRHIATGERPECKYLRGSDAALAFWASYERSFAALTSEAGSA